MNGWGNNIWGYVFGGQVFSNINDLITGNKDDGWDKLKEEDRVRFVAYVCRAGSNAVINGDYYSLDDIFAEELPKLDREWSNWKTLTGTIKYFDNYINPARKEIEIALNIIDQGKTNKAAALSRLRLANFTYASKSLVSSIINGNYYDPATDTETTEPTNTTLTSNAGFSLSAITNWLSSNPLLAVGILAAVGLAGYLMFSGGGSSQIIVQQPTPKQLK